MKVFLNVILNSFQDIIHKETRCRNKFGMTRIETKGFTLIELLVVIAIIGVLASFLIANFVSIKERARDGKRKTDLYNIQAALEIYRSDKSSYPDSISNCGSSWEVENTVYIQSMPCDPLNSTPFTYEYIYTAANGTYKLVACLENTSDLQKDVTNEPKCTSSVSFTLKNP